MWLNRSMHSDSPNGPLYFSFLWLWPKNLGVMAPLVAVDASNPGCDKTLVDMWHVEFVQGTQMVQGLRPRA